MSKFFNVSAFYVLGLTSLLFFGFVGITMAQANILDSQPDDSRIQYSTGGPNVTHTTQEKTFTTKNTVSNEPSANPQVPVINIFITPYSSGAPGMFPPMPPAPQPMPQQAQQPQAFMFVPVDPQQQPMQFTPQPPIMMQQPMMPPMMMQQPSMMMSPMMMQQPMMSPMMMQQPFYGGGMMDPYMMNMMNPNCMGMGMGMQQIAPDPYRATGLQPSVVAPSTVVYPNGVMVKPKVYLPGRFCHNLFQAITP